MANEKTILITGNHLTIEEVWRITTDRRIGVKVAPTAVSMAEKARSFLDEQASRAIIYGVNTGFGPMASHIIGREDGEMLQANLIRGHAMGIGRALPESYSLAAMVVRLNTLAKGYSGVSPALLDQLALFINRRIIPVVPEHGAVGTSGDLVQLAHIGLALIGGGEVLYRGKREPTRRVLRRLHIKPYRLKKKEGLSLINGTSMMTGIAALACMEAENLIALSLRSGAVSLEAVHAFDDSISPILHSLRPHQGQQAAARALRGILRSSGLLRSRQHFEKKFRVTNSSHVIPESVQEIYSLRCIPQIVGPAIDALRKARLDVVVEMNAVTDNPIVDRHGGRFLHGGNFHGDYIAATADHLKASLVKLTMLSERRTNFFLNARTNQFLPPFANLKSPGLTMGLQGLQFVATSTTAESQSLAFPHRIHSIPTNGDNQDVVSMGTDACLFAMRVIENAYVVFAVELITLAQAADFRKEVRKFSKPSRALLAQLREVFPAIVADRDVSAELPKVLAYARQIVHADSVRQYGIL